MIRSESVNQRVHLVLLLALGWFLILGIRYVIPVVLPQIVAEFEISNTSAGFAISILWFLYAVTQFPSGFLTDQYGEKTVLVLSLVLTVVSLFVFAGVTTFAVFLVSCLFYGIASGFYGPPRATILSKIFPDNAGIAFGFTLSIGSVGAALLPIVAVYIATEAGWRSAFLALVPLAVGICLGVVIVIPRSGDEDGSDGEDKNSIESADCTEDRNSVEHADAARDVDGERAETRSDSDSGPSVEMIIAALSHPLVLPAAIAATVMTFAFQAVTAFFPIYLVEVKTLDPSQASVLFGLMFASGAVSQPLSGVAADRFGSRRVLVFIAGISVVPFAMVPFVKGVVPLAVLAAVFGLQHGLVPVNNAYTVGMLPANVKGTAWGLIRTTMFAVGATGSMFLGALADAGLFDEGFIALSGLGVLTTLLYWALPARGRVDRQPLCEG